MKQAIKTLKIKTAVYLKCLEEAKKDKEHALNPASFDPSVRKLADEIAKKGYVIIKNYYPAEKCDELRAEIDKLIDENPGKIWVDDEKSDFRFFGIERLGEKIREYHDDAFLKNACECYLRAKSVNIFTLGARLEAKENNLGSGGGWHRDSEYEKQFKSIIYLSDVSLQSGPFQVIEKTNTNLNVVKFSGINVTKRYTEDNVKEFISKNDLTIKTIPGEKGDLILVDTRSIHRGMPIQEGTRHALTNYYCTLNRVDSFKSHFKDVIKV